MITVRRSDAPHHYMTISPLNSTVVARLNHQLLASSNQALKIEEHYKDDLYTNTYFPCASVALELCHSSAADDAETHCALKGYSRYIDIRLGDETFSKAAWQYHRMLDFDENLSMLLDHISFDHRQVKVEVSQ